MIYIFSQPIRSGKTTHLQKWLQNKKNIGGILTPDIAGWRKMKDLSNNQVYDLQLSNDKEGIKIGRFVFDRDVFDKANEILTIAKDKNYDWVVVDEVGRLEIDDNKGLAKSVKLLIQDYKKENKKNNNLLLVIRDYLLDKAIRYYQLESAKIITQSFFTNKNSINGLVLCAGKSNRMGQDKAFIQYHHLPQYHFTAEMIQQFCDTVYISATELQQKKMSDKWHKIKDKTTYYNNGPIGGLLSAIDYDSSQPILVTACDYPYLKRKNILSLIHNRGQNTDVICYQNEEKYYEPLIAIYEPRSFPKLIDFFNSGNNSLQQFLRKVNTQSITPKDYDILRSFDKIEDIDAFDINGYDIE